jgi:hypothetical protein
MVFRQLEFAGRAQHALAFHAAQLAHLDEERLAVVAGRQLGAHQRARHLDAHTRIGRATHDVEQGTLPHIHLAHAQAVRIGVLHGFLDFAHHNVGKGRRHGSQLFNLQAGHGQVSASSWVVSGGLQNSRNQDSGNCIVRKLFGVSS